MMAFCSFWYASNSGQNFAACSDVSVKFLAMTSALVLCNSARITLRTLSTEAPERLTGVLLAAGVCAARGVVRNPTNIRVLRVLNIVTPPEGRVDRGGKANPARDYSAALLDRGRVASLTFPIHPNDESSDSAHAV